MKKVIRTNTLEEAELLIDTIITCKGSVRIPRPLKSIWWIDDTLYGFLVFIADEEQECLSQDLIDKLQYIPDGLVNKFVNE